MEESLKHVARLPCLRKGGKSICGRSCTVKILKNSIQEVLGLLSATTSLLSHLNSTGIYLHGLKREKKNTTPYLFILLQILQTFI